MLWLLAHYDEIEDMHIKGLLTQAQRESYMQRAIREDNTYLLTLVLMERIVNKAEGGQDSKMR